MMNQDEYDKDVWYMNNRVNISHIFFIIFILLLVFFYLCVKLIEKIVLFKVNDIFVCRKLFYIILFKRWEPTWRIWRIYVNSHLFAHKNRHKISGNKQTNALMKNIFHLFQRDTSFRIFTYIKNILKFWLIIHYFCS